MQAVAGVVVQRVERKLRQPIPMNSPGLPLTGIHIWRRIFLLVAFGITGCANSDFGQVNQTLVTDGIHDWIGRDALQPKASHQPSNTPMTNARCATTLIP
jgi:hypothetical protein